MELNQIERMDAQQFMGIHVISYSGDMSTAAGVSQECSKTRSQFRNANATQSPLLLQIDAVHHDLYSPVIYDYSELGDAGSRKSSV